MVGVQRKAEELMREKENWYPASSDLLALLAEGEKGSERRVQMFLDFYLQLTGKKNVKV